MRGPGSQHPLLLKLTISPRHAIHRLCACTFSEKNSLKKKLCSNFHSFFSVSLTTIFPTGQYTFHEYENVIYDCSIELKLKIRYVFLKVLENTWNFL